MEIVPDDGDEMLIEATPLSSRSPTIIDYKIHKEGKKTYFKIIRADGNSQVYQTFEKMFKNFNKEDLKVLWAIVKDRFKKEKPMDDMYNLLFRTLKAMFEHHVVDTIWKYQQGLAKAISLPQDVPSTSGRRLIQLENQVQRLMKAHLASKPKLLLIMDRVSTKQEAGGKLHDQNAKESWALLEDLTLYDDENWNDPKDLTKPVKAIDLTQDFPSTSDRHLIELENQYCMEDPVQAFVEYASSRVDETRDKWYTFKPEKNNLGDTYNPSWRSHQNLRLTKFEADFKQQQSEMTNKIDTVLKAITNRISGALLSDTIKSPKLSTYPVLSAHSYPTEDPQCSTHVHGNFTYIIDFMIVKDISSIIDPRLSQVVIGRPFTKIFNMTHDPPKRVVRFTNGNDKVAYKIPHKIEQYNSLSNLEKEHTKSVYLRNEEDKQRRVE
nr:MAK10-like protein [Tanacetum cinerariifolium]